MNIEIHSIPSVPEDVVNLAKKQVMELKHRNAGITRAAITFRDAHLSSAGKICEIKLNSPGDSIYTVGKAQTFKNAVNLAFRQIGAITKKPLTKDKA